MAIRDWEFRRSAGEVSKWREYHPVCGSDSRGDGVWSMCFSSR